MSVFRSRSLRSVVALAALAVSMSVVVHTPAQARPNLCRDASNQWCRGVQGPDGQYLTPGAPGWEQCITDAVSVLVECVSPPDGSGATCYIGGFYFEC